MAKEYIEREAALNASKIVYIEYIEVDGEGYEDGNADNIPVVFKKDIEALPAADVVEVVRCKDCKHRLERNGKFECIYDTGDPFAQGREADIDDWFCADGERRELQDG